MYRQRINNVSTQYQRYLQIHKRGARGLNLTDWGRVLGWVCLLGSLVFWVPMEWIIAEPIDSLWTALIATTFGLFMTFGPPIIVSIFVPGTRAGRLLLKLNMTTPGKIVALGVGIFLLFHAGQLLSVWWAGRAAARYGLLWQQVILGVIFTVIAPALLFEPVSQDELKEQLEQAHQTQVYEIATQSRINLMLKAQHNAESLMAAGLENLNAQQLTVVARYITNFVKAVDDTHRAWREQIQDASGLTMQYRSLGADPRTTEFLGFLGNLVSVSNIDISAIDNELEQYIDASLQRGDQRIQPLPAPIAHAGPPIPPTLM